MNETYQCLKSYFAVSESVLNHEAATAEALGLPTTLAVLTAAEVAVG